METAGVTQRVDGKADLAALASDNHLNLTPVVLKLETGLGLETDRLLARSQGPHGLNVHPHNGDTDVDA